MAAMTRSAERILSDRAEIARRYLRGDYQTDIGATLGLSQRMVSYDLTAIRKEWRGSSVRDFDDAKSQELAKIDELERTYWAAWEASCKARATTTTTKSVGDTTTTRATHRSEAMLGNPAYLAGVMTCIERRCKLLGIDAPEKSAIDLNVVTKALLGVDLDKI